MGRSRLGRLVLGLCVSTGLAISASRDAEAAFTYTVLEQGADVVATGSGRINLAGLSLFNASAGLTGISAASGYIGIAYDLDNYRGFSGPSGFGSGGDVFASSTTGDSIALAVSEGNLGVPPGYRSTNNAPLSNSMTFTGQSFASMGLTPGTYVWTWGSGDNADSFTVQIGPLATVPEPASALLIGAGLLGLAATRRRRTAD